VINVNYSFRPQAVIVAEHLSINQHRGVWERDLHAALPPRDRALRSFESGLVNWTKQFREKRTGMFVFIVKDAADREWRVPFLEASWTKGGREFKSRVLN